MIQLVSPLKNESSNNPSSPEMTQAIDPSIIIIGAGPAGCASALMLAQKGIRAIVLKKSTFPLDKICGNALSNDVLNQLNMITPSLAEHFYSIEEKLPVHRGTMVSSEGLTLSIPIINNRKRLKGCTCSRMILDNYFFEDAHSNQVITLKQQCQINLINPADHAITLETNQGVYTADMLIGTRRCAGRYETKDKIV